MSLLRSKGGLTQLQILVEIASQQPNIRQSDIASKLGITVQAVSEHMRELASSGMIRELGRGKWKVTYQGVNYILRGLRELREYSRYLEDVVTDIAVCAAVAADRISAGDEVFLWMDGGILYAGKKGKGDAKGVAVSDADEGQDVGISGVEGIVKIPKVTVKVCRIPKISNGGSSAVDFEKLKRELEGMIGAIGVESLVALRRIGVEPQIQFSVADAAVECASRGVMCTVACVDDEIPNLLSKLEGRDIPYKVIDVRSASKSDESH